MIAYVAALAFLAPWAASDRPSALEPRPSPHFDVSAQFRPGKSAGTGEVAVTFAPKDPDVRINAVPAPRLTLDEDQNLLTEKAAARRTAAPGEKYIDTTFPVVFPVAVHGPARSELSVKGSVTYYYCSHREGWCKKGTAPLEIPVKGR
jgi:hypothetical protein